MPRTNLLMIKIVYLLISFFVMLFFFIDQNWIGFGIVAAVGYFLYGKFFGNSEQQEERIRQAEEYKQLLDEEKNQNAKPNVKVNWTFEETKHPDYTHKKRPRYGPWIDLEDFYGLAITVVGVGYDNRQDAIKKLKGRCLIDYRLYTYESEPAIELYYKGESIGNVPKEKVGDITPFLKHLDKIVVIEKYFNTSDDQGVKVDFRLSLSAKALIEKSYKQS